MPVLKDTDYTLKITHSAIHPPVQFPDSPIPENAYEPVHDRRELQLRFSDKGGNVTILPNGVTENPKKVSGKLQGKAADERIYLIVSAGLGEHGKLTLRQTKQGLMGTYTTFGSGVPVLGSYRGMVTEKSAKAGHAGTDHPSSKPRG